MEFVREIPEWAKISDYLKEKAEGYLVFRLYGKRYFVPVNPNFKKVFGLKRDGDELVTNGPISLDFKFDKVLKSIADSLLLQIRDTVGDDISDDLSQQLTTFLEEKLEPSFDRLVKGQMEQKLLPEDSGLCETDEGKH